jgi:hypothetical protein
VAKVDGAMGNGGSASRIALNHALQKLPLAYRESAGLVLFFHEFIGMKAAYLVRD